MGFNTVNECGGRIIEIAREYSHNNKFSMKHFEKILKICGLKYVMRDSNALKFDLINEE